MVHQSPLICTGLSTTSQITGASRIYLVASRRIWEASAPFCWRLVTRNPRGPRPELTELDVRYARQYGKTITNYLPRLTRLLLPPPSSLPQFPSPLAPHGLDQSF